MKKGTGKNRLLVGRFLSLALGLSALWLTQGCTTVPVTGRHELNFMSAGEETQLGLSSFDQVKKDTPINHDPAVNEMVQRVGRRVADVAGKDLPNAQWEFVVFESKEANAFCLPGGKVGVYTGLLPITKDDAGLATVLGHEIGHAVAHHGASRMSQAQVSQGLGQLAGSAVGSTQYAQYQQVFMSLYGLGSQVLVELPYSRTQESEADHIGLVYMARAGYDPAQAVAFWQRFAAYNKQQGGGGPAFLRTHPVDEVRIKQLQGWLPEAQGQYKPQ
jgi:predicted Zn-dependent protease